MFKRVRHRRDGDPVADRDRTDRPQRILIHPEVIQRLLVKKCDRGICHARIRSEVRRHSRHHLRCRDRDAQRPLETAALSVHGPQPDAEPGLRHMVEHKRRAQRIRADGKKRVVIIARPGHQGIGVRVIRIRVRRLQNANDRSGGFECTHRRTTERDIRRRHPTMNRPGQAKQQRNHRTRQARQRDAGRA